MSRNTDALSTQIDPILRDVWESNTPNLFSLVDMHLVRESIDTITHPEKSTMKLPFMLVSFFSKKLEKWREEGVGRVSVGSRT
jgi:hypothetical protein